MLAMIIEKENNKIIGLIGPVHITNSILTKKNKQTSIDFVWYLF